jgi:hypothetical protein
MHSIRPSLRIRKAPPVRGIRESLCSSDEAAVSRIVSPRRYEGLVERLQKPGMNALLMDTAFSISLMREPLEGTYDVSSEEHHNFMLRFLALRLARSIHPDNFVNTRELRLHGRDSSGLTAAMYSDFVPDEGGVIARRTEFSRRFYSSEDDGERKSIQLKSNAAEHSANPSLANHQRLMELSGIFIPHPEANYHVSGGKTVFFEVLGIDAPKAFSAAVSFSPEPEESLALLSTMLAVVFRRYAGMNPRNALMLEELFRTLDFNELSNVIFGILSEHADSVMDGNLRHRCGLFNDIHSSMQYAYAMSIGTPCYSRRSGPANGWPVSIDQALL